MTLVALLLNRVEEVGHVVVLRLRLRRAAVAIFRQLAEEVLLSGQLVHAAAVPEDVVDVGPALAERIVSLLKILRHTRTPFSKLYL